MYGIRRRSCEPVIDMFTIEVIEPPVRARTHGRSHIEEITAGQRSSGQSSRSWGVWTKRANRSVAVDHHLWP
jgi:hypothetical protein